MIQKLQLLDTDVPEVINRDTVIHDDDPRIRVHSLPVQLPLSKEDEDLVLKMHQFVVDSQDPEKSEKFNLQPAVGIAAIQLGINKQMLAVYCPAENEEDTFSYALVNPKIISRSRQMTYLPDGEGCLSVPESVCGLVCRPAHIKVRAYDALTKQNVVIEANDYDAVVLQHEIDHLSGILYYDHINKENPQQPVPNSYSL